MASGSVTGNKSNEGRKFVFYWSSTYSSPGVSYVSWHIDAVGGSSSWYMSSFSLSINGSKVDSQGWSQTYKGTKGSGGFYVYHDSAGAGAFSVSLTSAVYYKASGTKTATCWCDTNVPYSACGIGSCSMNKTNNSIIVPKIDNNYNTITITASGWDGTANPIAGFRFYIKRSTNGASPSSGGCSTVYVSTEGGTSASYTYKLTSADARGNYLWFGAVAVGSVNGYDSGLLSCGGWVRINSLPQTPAAEVNSAGQRINYLPIDATTTTWSISNILDSVDTSQTKKLYYKLWTETQTEPTSYSSRDISGTTTSLTHTLLTGRDPNREYKVYCKCKTYDGLEYGSETTQYVTITKQFEYHLDLKLENPLVVHNPDSTNYVYGGGGLINDNPSIFSPLNETTSIGLYDKSWTLVLNYIKNGVTSEDFNYTGDDIDKIKIPIIELLENQIANLNELNTLSITIKSISNGYSTDSTPYSVKIYDIYTAPDDEDNHYTTTYKVPGFVSNCASSFSVIDSDVYQYFREIYPEDEGKAAQAAESCGYRRIYNNKLICKWNILQLTDQTEVRLFRTELRWSSDFEGTDSDEHTPIAITDYGEYGDKTIDYANIPTDKLFLWIYVYDSADKLLQTIGFIKTREDFFYRKSALSQIMAPIMTNTGETVYWRPFNTDKDHIQQYHHYIETISKYVWLSGNVKGCDSVLASSAPECFKYKLELLVNGNSVFTFFDKAYYTKENAGFFLFNTGVNYCHTSSLSSSLDNTEISIDAGNPIENAQGVPDGWISAISYINSRYFDGNRLDRMNSDKCTLRWTATDIFQQSSSAESNAFTIDYRTKPFWKSSAVAKVQPLYYGETTPYIKSNYTKSELTLHKEDKINFLWDGIVNLNGQDTVSYTDIQNFTGDSDCLYNIYFDKDKTTICASASKSIKTIQRLIQTNEAYIQNNTTKRFDFYLTAWDERSGREFESDILLMDNPIYKIPLQLNPTVTFVTDNMNATQVSYTITNFDEIYQYNTTVGANYYTPLERYYHDPNPTSENRNNPRYKFQVYKYKTYQEASEAIEKLVFSENDRIVNDSVVTKSNVHLNQLGSINNTAITRLNEAVVFLVGVLDIYYGTSAGAYENAADMTRVIHTVTQPYTLVLGLPTVSYRENSLGINGEVDASTNSALLIQNLGALGQSSYLNDTININDLTGRHSLTIYIHDGQFDGAVIDCGQWISQVFLDSEGNTLQSTEAKSPIIIMNDWNLSLEQYNEEIDNHYYTYNDVVKVSAGPVYYGPYLEETTTIATLSDETFGIITNLAATTADDNDKSYKITFANNVIGWIPENRILDIVVE